jgi:selenide, water dikinase
MPRTRPFCDFPRNMALVQTVDFFTPIVNNPYWFGQIAAANSLSDVYAMGGSPYCAMNIVCFPVKHMSKDILKDILRGGLAKILEAGAVLAGGHSVEDREIKYGLSVTGIVDPQRYATNGGLRPGDTLILTKPLGTGVLATGLKADLPGAAELEELLYYWAARLNRVGAAKSSPSWD